MRFLLMALLALPFSPQQSATGKPTGTVRDAASAKATAVIKGHVVSAVTGRPLRRALIRVTAPGLSEPRTTSTDLLGEYEIADLPPGRYSITVTRSGHLTLQYGQRRYGETGSPLQLDEGQKADKIDFALQRAGIIGGRILDDAGEPISGVLVYPMQRQFYQGRAQLVPAALGGRTDDTGQYRLLSIPPGDYIVMATARETWVSDTEPPQSLAFAPTFYPGTANAADGLRVTVKPGEEVASTDFNMVVSHAATLSGTALTSDGLPMAGSTVQVTQEIMGPGGGTMSSVGQGRVAPDGTWKIVNVPPGEYRLRVTPPNRERAAESASALVTVQGNDIEGVALRSDAGGILVGQVVADGDGALPASAQPMRVFPQSLSNDRRSISTTEGEDDGLVGQDGSFTRRSTSGAVSLRVQSLPTGWAVKRIEIGGADRTNLPLDVPGGGRVEKIKILISNRFPSVTGRMTDEKGSPVDGTALLFPADSLKWTDWTMNARTARPDQSGVYRFDTVRPGEYFVIALDGVQQWQVNDPDFLEALQSGATRVTLDEGASQTINLRVKR